MSDSFPPVCEGVSVVVPVHNGAKTLESLVERVESAVASRVAALEIVFVNDGSADDSWSVIERLATENARVRGINLMRNCGQHSALLAGIRDAREPITVTIDDDLQNPPEEIPRLLDELAQGHDVVYGSPRREQHGFFRDLASRLTKRVMASVMGIRAARHASAFRAFRTHLRGASADFHGSFPSIDVLLSWGTRRFATVAVDHQPRELGASGYSVRRLVTHAINMMTGFSVLPLRIATLMGFLFTLLGFGVLAYVVGRVLLTGSSVPGFPFLASIIALFSGAQLFALGIFGEYLARMHFRLMDRPPYVIHERTEGSEKTDG